MLSTLNVQNFAIVSKLCLDCPSKMSAFTGETGAGKSIMIDALGILFGAKVDASIIRPDAETCEISAQFFYDLPSLIDDFLKQHALEQEQGEVIVRRVIYREGRSKYFINGRVSTAQQVKTLGHLLIHIHGQHEQQDLLAHATHREHLDHFAQLFELRSQVKQAYTHHQDCLKKLQELEHQRYSQEQLQLWEYQYQEMMDLAPQEGELDLIYREHHLLHHAQTYLQEIASIENLIDGDTSQGAAGQLHQVAQLLQHLPKDEKNIQNAIQLLDAALIQIDEMQAEIKQYAKKVQINPERLSELETRMQAWHRLARKFQIDVHQLPSHLDVLKLQIANCKNADETKNKAKIACEQAKQNYSHLALQLRQARENAAPDLAAAIESIIHELGMPHAKLKIDLQALSEMQPHGLDKIEYLIATNPGAKLDPLAKVASGGELSRISLSIHLITAQRGATPTLLFDEVDVGIGGATAMKVGRRLRELGDRLQIFCVTHQAQVASCAHQHFLVEKYTDGQQTYSSIHALDDAGRVAEIARMLGGLEITEQTKNSARELLGSC
jgi:DNA repair protein RecN (Recombination protein N)